MKRFEFIFQGNQAQYDLLLLAVNVRLPESDIKLDYVEGKDFNCSMVNEGNTIFKMGMLLAAVYSSFGHLKYTSFDSE